MRKLFATRLCFLLLLLFYSLSDVLTQQRNVSDGERLSMYAKPSVVRILDGYIGTFIYRPPDLAGGRSYTVPYVASGSGLIINSSGYIATNAHVVNFTQQGEEKAKETLFNQYLITLARSYNIDPNSLTRQAIGQIAQYSELQNMRHIHHVILPSGSNMPFDIKAFGAPIGEGKDVAIIKIELKNAPILKLGDSDKMQLQDHVTVLGYPAAADTFDSGILDEKSSLEASITDGKLSARKRTASGAPILQVSAPATHGNSGGPVINDQNEVVGLLTFGGDTVKGQEISGFTFVVPASTIMEFIKQSGINNDLGVVDQTYREALNLYWQGHYTQAKAKFEEVKRLFPQHSEVDGLIQGSQQAISEGKDRTGLPIWLIAVPVVLILFIAFATIVGLLVFLVLRKKRRHKSVGSQSNLLANGPYQNQAQQLSSAVPAPSHGNHPTDGFTTAPRTSDSLGATMDLSKTLAVGGAASHQPLANFGSILFTSGQLSGQKFEIRPEGFMIGRDNALAQIVIADPRISKRHLWVGPRNGHLVVIDQESRNGTYINSPTAQRVTESILNSGDMVIVSEPDAATFKYQI